MISPLRLLPLLCCLVPSAFAENWPNWRGPRFDGSSEETALPEKFSPTENCLWAAPMPGPAASTPVIWEDSVFVTTTHEQEKKLLGLCLDRKTGKVKWEKQIGEGFSQDERSNYAGPSPVTDGKLVVFFFGTGDLAAFTLDGEEKWRRNIQKDYGNFAFMWTFSSSPVLYDGTLYLQVLQRDTFYGHNAPRGVADAKPAGSFLLAMDPETGKEKWRKFRASDAQGESLEAFSTPIPWTHNGRSELLIAGGDCITGHDPKTGEELWRWGTWNPEKISHWRLVPSPVAGDGVILACAPKRAPVYAFKAGLSGTQKDDALLWVSGDDVNSQHVSSDVSTPLFYKNRFYVMNSDRKSLACVEPKSGKLIWEHRVEGGAKIEASPTGADGKIYFQDHRGTVTVLAAGDEPKVLHTADFGGRNQRDIRSSISAAHGCLFIRTNDKLYCVGAK